MSIFQCLIALVAEENQLENCLFLANMTTPPRGRGGSLTEAVAVARPVLQNINVHVLCMRRIGPWDGVGRVSGGRYRTCGAPRQRRMHPVLPSAPHRGI
jgi:hypothetical protein